METSGDDPLARRSSSSFSWARDCVIEGEEKSEDVKTRWQINGQRINALQTTCHDFGLDEHCRSISSLSLVP